MNSNNAALTEPCPSHVREDATELCLAIVRQTPAVRVTAEEAAEVVAVRIHVDVARPDAHHLHQPHTASKYVGHLHATLSVNNLTRMGINSLK